MKLSVALSAALALALVAPATAAPARSPKRTPKSAVSKRGAQARVAFARAGVLKTVREAIGRREEPLTLEEDTAKQIAKLLRGPGLRNGVTGLFVADARTGQPLFAVNADDPFNPASNVKMISTATALDLLGPEFRYSTRLLGSEPAFGVVRGDVYLLGSYDPTLSATSLDDIAVAVAGRGITAIEGDIVVGSDPTRDGIFRAVLPIEITAGEPGEPPAAAVPLGADHVTVIVNAKTSKRAHRPRLTYKTETIKEAGKPPRIQLTIGGTLGKHGSATYRLWTRERTATAVYALRAALLAHNVTVSGDMKVVQLGDFIGDAVAAGALPVELGRHESARLGDIVTRVNKWSVNWLADRVVMTASALVRRAPPSMDLAVEAMYGWLARHPQLAAKGLVLDTGSGLSYRTRITPSAIVAVIRSAAGFDDHGVDPAVAQAWLDSLSIARHDGTLRRRLRGADTRARVRGKTGTLSTVIAMSGVLDIDPDRPLAFALVTNTDTPLSKRWVRKAHDRVMATLCSYLAKATRSPDSALPPAPAVPEIGPVLEPSDAEDAEGAADEDDHILDVETADS